jgi:hypothetical protein
VNALEDSSGIVWGTADGTKNSSDSSLLFERLGDLAVAVLELVEQASVLDGDDGLVGEGFECGDLGVVERLRHAALHRDASDHLPALLQGHSKDGEHGVAGTVIGGDSHAAKLVESAQELGRAAFVRSNGGSGLRCS